MKIKGKFIIPLIAVLVAMFTLGITPGFAADTTVSDSLTYVPVTPPATSSVDEEIEGFISSAFSDDLQQAEGPLREFSELMAGMLASIKNVLNSIITFFQSIGGLTGGNFGGLLCVAGSAII